MKTWATVASGVVLVGATLSYWIASRPPEGMIVIPSGPAVLGYVYYTGLYGPRPYEVSEFMIDRFEVTNADYAEFVADIGHKQPAFYDDEDFNRETQPVTGVMHEDASTFCEWAGKRLPTELEWEKAARGVEGQIYPWGDEMDNSFAYISGNAPKSVNDFPNDVSPYGVRGMAGNVSEWVSDTRVASAGVCRDINNRLEENITPEMREILDTLKAANGGVLPELCIAPNTSELDAPEEPCAYIKGNSWNGLPHMTVSSNRMWDYTNTYAEFVGFRCAASVN